MRNIKLIIEYDGTNYAGWQRQNSRQSPIANRQSPITVHKLKTIQEVIEDTLQRILQEKVKVIASGRTDSGAHSLGQVANFKTKSALSALKIQEALNALLPEDISIRETQEVDSRFHACYCAKSKLYRYFILQGKVSCAFLRRYSWHIPYSIDVKLMQQEAKRLLGRHDFKSFCASSSGAKTTARTIKKISIKNTRCSLIANRYPMMVIDIEADGFLYNMVRNIVGTLVEIGRGRFGKGSIGKILSARDRKLAGPTAAAKGLFLAKVSY
jgi:tRNA pseudouridine38-40 synthase